MIDVSIIIPTKNNYKVLKNCLDNLWESEKKINYEVILFDNGSDQQEVLDYYKTIEDKATIVMNDQNYHFSKANNLAVDYAKGKYLLFLNNDTIPQPNFLTELINCFENHTRVGIVGAKMFFPNSTKIQHIGAIIRADGLPTHQHYGKDYNDINIKNLADQERKCVGVTFACALMPTKLFKEIGGLDEKYINGFEDIDFCFKLKEKGYKILYCPKSFLYHIEHGSGMITNEHFQKNATLFLQKWHRKLSTVNVL